MDNIVIKQTGNIYRAAVFGVLIILVVFLPILTLDGIEGKTFRPMAQTVSFAILGSMLLSVTYVPVMASIFLNKNIKNVKTWSDKFIDFLKRMYEPVVHFAISWSFLTLGSTLIVFIACIVLFSSMGAEFVPTLEEGDIAMQQTIKPGSSLNESIHTSTMAERILMENFPEVEHIVSKIGTAEVPTDPMAIEDADVMIILKDKEEWTSADNREDLMALMKEKLAPITWASFEFTQPIQLRFNELMTGSKSDISIKIFGENVAVLKAKADEVAEIVRLIEGAGDVKVDQTDGLRQLSVKYNRERLAQYGINVEDVNQVIRAAYAGEQVGDIFEQERKFDLVVRIAPEYRQELDLAQLTINTATGQQLPLNALANIENTEGPMLISREQARRFINIGVNVRNRDVSTLVSEIQQQLQENLTLPAGYEIQYGGQFENLEHARDRLMLAVPIALALILLLLYIAFNSVMDTLIIFMAVPLSAVGGILALWLRDMPFSISSGIGFIALFGVSVLNGIVLLSAIKQLNGRDFPYLRNLISTACLSRLRPVLMTALVAALGFLPMAISTGSGAEVQRPLATVVIGGLISSTLLTLVVLPTLYYLIFKTKWMKQSVAITLVLFGLSGISNAQTLSSYDEVYTYTIQNHPLLQNNKYSQEAELLNKDAMIQWGRLNINYQGGQINYDGYDNYVYVNQDLTPLFRGRERKAKKEWIDSKVIMLDIEQQILLNDIKYQLGMAFNEWYYWNSRKQLYDSIFHIYHNLVPKVKLQFDVGEIDIVEYELFNNDTINYKQSQVQLEKRMKAAELRIKKVALLPDSLLLVAQVLQQLEEVQSSLVPDKNIYIQSFQWRKQVIAKEMEVEKIAPRQASWNIGYFAQSLEKSFRFQGVMAGVQIPLDRRASKVKVHQLELKQKQLDNNTWISTREFEQEIISLENDMQYLDQSIQDYENTALPNQSRIFRNSNIQFEEGELDFLRYSQIQERLIAGQNAYLDWIKSYNESVLQIVYLTQLINN